MLRRTLRISEFLTVLERGKMPGKIEDILRNHSQGQARARRGRGLDDRAAHAHGRDRPARRHRRLRQSLCRYGARPVLVRSDRRDLHGGARGRHHAAGARAGCGRSPARARCRRARRHRSACAERGRGARLCDAPQNFRRSASAPPRRPAPSALSSAFRSRSRQGDERSDHGGGAIRERRSAQRADAIVSVDGVDMVLIGSNDMLAELRASPASTSIRGCATLTPHHRSLPPPRQACRRRRAVVAPAACRAIRENGRALCLDRHRSRLPARGLHGEGEGSARDGGELKNRESSRACMVNHQLRLLRQPCHAIRPWFCG